MKAMRTWKYGNPYRILKGVGDPDGGDDHRQGRRQYCCSPAYHGKDAGRKEGLKKEGRPETVIQPINTRNPNLSKKSDVKTGKRQKARD